MGRQVHSYPCWPQHCWIRFVSRNHQGTKVGDGDLDEECFCQAGRRLGRNLFPFARKESGPPSRTNPTKISCWMRSTDTCILAPPTWELACVPLSILIFPDGQRKVLML